jgi:transposase
MAGKRVPMRKIREVLRLTHEMRLSVREVRAATGVGKTAVADYVTRARAIGITWPIPPEIDDTELERRLFVPPAFRAEPVRTVPDWAVVHEELKRRGVTLLLLWEEHRAACPDGHCYSQFCVLYREWRRKLSPVMRQSHLAGDKLFVDWAGDTVPVIDAASGKTMAAHIFVAVSGASSYTFAVACWSETLPDWIAAHAAMLDFLGGVPKAVVPDNLKAGITTPSRYEPGVNRTYQDLAAHYDFVVLPARPYKPRDKAKVEAAVGIVERYILGRLRNRRFLGLDDLNAAVAECVTTINAKIMRHVGKSRADLFAALDRPVLKSLPPTRFEYAEWKRATVAPDYHIEVDDHFYSVPWTLLRETVDVRVTTVMIEVLHKGILVAVHVRSYEKGLATSLDEHRSPGHKAHAEWTLARVAEEAAKIGPETAKLVAAITAAKPHPEQALRTCIGILRLTRSFEPERVEAAARRGNAIGSKTLASIRSILDKGLDRVAPIMAPEPAPIVHENIRGRGYYH